MIKTLTMAMAAACLLAITASHHAQPHDPDAATRPEVGGLIDLPMYTDPVLEPAEVTQVFDLRLLELWQQALDRPEADLRRQAAEALADATRQGMTGGEAAASRLAQLVVDDAEVSVRYAAVDALAAINARDQAAAILQANQQQSHAIELVLLCDEVLAAWDVREARDLWQERLSSERVSVAVSAARSLGAVEDESALDALLAIVLNQSAAARLRLAAAQAIGQLQVSTTHTSASQLVDRGESFEIYLAANLLQSATDQEAAQVLTRIAMMADDHPAGAALSLARLSAIAVEGTDWTDDRWVASRDSSVRMAVTQGLIAKGDASSIAVLGRLLGDPAVGVRTVARPALFDFHASEPDAVTQAIALALESNDWRRLEQAALLAGQIDATAFADRMVQLLAHDRHEVQLASAHSLRQLEVEQTLSDALAFARTLEANPEDGDLATQLFMLFGKLNYEPAVTTMRPYLPKNSGYATDARGAAVYAIGLIYEDRAHSELAGILRGRMTDNHPMEPEADNVRRLAAIALGRMQHRESLGALRSTAMPDDMSGDELIAACRWAIAQIEGGEIEPLPSREQNVRGWFLEPLR